ncbi:MAG TPA: DNA mismatch repair endonuclease MutL [Clostridia bacterium]|nr:DNA mismatch repair endonuclease MutL [Clostridia bacterium]
MQIEKTQPRRIHLLRDSVAQKIAAGEVIDRPFSVVRELLDNAIDSGADSIDLYIEGGGIRRIRVLDNGSGMDREDLELCYKPHATSKISAVGDIYNLHTLGFRGEALASVAACAKLTITSAPVSAEPHTLEVRNGSPIRLELSRGTQGTVVDVSDLFYAMPGRRKFLKSPGAETSACTRTFIEKALPFPDISFRLFTDDQLKLYLPAADLQKRIGSAYPSHVDPHFLNSVEEEAGRFKIKALLASPAIHRRDRRNIHVYVNRRRIQEFSLVQAVHYAYEQLLPGGAFPVAFIFLEIDPELVDFNIHPAKREVKIKNLPEIHHQLVHSLKEHLNRKYIAPQEPQHTSAPGMNFGPPPTDQPFTVPLEKWKEFGTQRAESAAEQALEVQASKPKSSGSQEIEYVGQVFDLFLIVRRGDSLYMIDQHAAHERIIYEQLTGGTMQSQNLLVPYGFEVEEDVEGLLRQRLGEYKQIGIQLEQEKPGRWRITRVPARFVGMEEQLIKALQSQEASESAFKARLFADLACKAAVKDGEALDRYSAADLARQAFELPIPRCPHGRPIWFRISRDELFEIVGRT